jgi:hypothetical protein
MSAKVFYTDYDISWDYEIDDQLEDKYIKKIDRILKAIQKRIKHEIIKNIIVTPVILKAGQLGTYCHGTKQYIGVDIRNIIEHAHKEKRPVYEEIQMTILHEIAHALQEFEGKEADELEAEEFATMYVEYHEIIKI